MEDIISHVREYKLILYIRGDQPKLVSGLQLENFAKNIDFLGYMITKT
jgi:hypothetical protein